MQNLERVHGDRESAGDVLTVEAQRECCLLHAARLRRCYRVCVCETCEGLRELEFDGYGWELGWVGSGKTASYGIRFCCP